MNKELDIDDITLLIARARQYRSDASGKLIARGSRRLPAWLLDRGDRCLQSFDRRWRAEQICDLPRRRRCADRGPASGMR